MRFKWLCLFLTFFSLPASASIDIDSIVKKVKGYVGDQLTRAYCMVKRDCHQRVIYVVNVSQSNVQLEGCQFSSGQTLTPNQELYTTQKNSAGSHCMLSISKSGQLNTKVNLTPHAMSVEYLQHQSADCFVEHRVLKSWKKCPWLCGKYEVKGYIGICVIGD